MYSILIDAARAAANTPSGDSASVFSPDFVTALGRYLSFGTIGVGLALAVCATILMIFSKANSIQFLIFAGVIVCIGAGLEVLRLVEDAAQKTADRDAKRFQSLPDQLWSDFFEARGNVLFRSATPLPASIDGEEIRQNETRSFKVAHLSNLQCRYYFVAVKPPAKLDLSFKPTDLIVMPGTEKDYYKSGTLCAPNAQDGNGSDVELDATALEAGGQFSMAFFVAPPQEASAKSPVATPAASPSPAPAPGPTPPPPSFTKVVCIGEFEGGCHGTHQIWYGCGAPPEDKLAPLICGGAPAKWRRLITNGGNQCGYALDEFTCG
ncbi:hypothetical protein PY650_05935 [Rhizobium calliandrae]|uniref:Uncharacterized protein n=1 Tax=Rhizobium calliandrae TaxID=1312182 RepID=A0ABT7KDH3_9HYPH|nr:hypothetical protein [Rhizobium calliandrae]MDL2405199.1 hypothetical protein [Rhizobium calliandrae]